jgi:hypothetical protein
MPQSRGCGQIAKSLPAPLADIGFAHASEPLEQLEQRIRLSFY